MQVLTRVFKNAIASAVMLCLYCVPFLGRYKATACVSTHRMYVRLIVVIGMAVVGTFHMMWQLSCIL